MKRVLTLKSTFAFLLAVIIFRLCFTAPAVKADRDVAHNVDLLLVYDKSYEAFMHDGYNITNYGNRIEQLAMLGEVPFAQQFDIHFNVTTGTYADYLGVDPALSCTIYHQPGPDYQGAPARMIWEYYKICECDGLPHSQHHTRASYYASIAKQYAIASSAFDNVAIVKAHRLCYSDNEYIVAGVGTVGNAGFVINGRYGVDGDPTNSHQFINLLTTRNYFMHEISHNFGATDGYNNPGHCAANEPCIMNNGFSNVVYFNKAWCSVCQNAIDPSTFD